MNSQILRDSLKINPVNYGIQGSIGLSFLLRSTASRVRRGDVVLIVPEYNNFYGDFAYGSEPLLRLILDVNKSDVRYLGIKHAACIAPYLPKYFVSKYKPSEYYYKPKPAEKVYSREAFNQYGDAVAHWELPPVKFTEEPELGGKFNHDLVLELEEFEVLLSKKGAKLFISFPSFDEHSYRINERQISEVEKVLREKFTVISRASDYKFRHEQMFNTPYHLNGKAVNVRTRQLVSDLKKTMSG